MENNDTFSRRELLSKGFKTAATLGLGMTALGAFGDKASIAGRAWANFDRRALYNESPDLVCEASCKQTLGPCYYPANLIRSDVREGYPGLASKIVFRVVNIDTCSPMSGVSIDIWHTNWAGAYSAPISTFCNGTDPANQAARFCRGIQTTDADGYATFITNFPGWYSGRTIHIHATLRIGTTEILTTQFYFTDKVGDYVLHNYAPYTGRGERNTRNTTDNILGGSLVRMAPYIFSTNTLRDRSLIATKTIGIRNVATTCNA